MKSLTSLALSLLIGLSFIGLVSPVNLHAADQSENLKAQVVELEGQIAVLKAENDALKKENQSLRRLLNAQKQQTTVTPAQQKTNTVQPQVPEKKATGYWITTSSGVRHNSSCRYYKNSRGRECGPDEGRACKICGG